MKYQLAHDLVAAFEQKGDNNEPQNPLFFWPTDPDKFHEHRDKYKKLGTLDSEDYMREFEQFDFSIYTIADGKVKEIKSTIDDRLLGVLLYNIPIGTVN